MYDVNLLQIYCDCETESLRRRFKERMKKDSYHKGHRHTIDLYGEERILHSFGVKDKRLDINGVTYDLDTTNPETINYEELFGFIENNMQNR